MYELGDVEREIARVFQEIGFEDIHMDLEVGLNGDDRISLYTGDDGMGGYPIEVHIKYYDGGTFIGRIQVRVVYTDVDGTEWSSAFACREAGDARIGMLFDCDGMQESFFDALTKVFLVSK